MRLNEIDGSDDKKEGEPRRFAYLYLRSDAVSATYVHMCEGKRKLQTLSKGWVLAWDASGPYDGAEPHVHVFRNGNELYSVNISGTGHDGNHGQKIHNVPLKGIRAKWPKVGPIIEGDGSEFAASSYVPDEVKDDLDSLELDCTG